MMDLCALCGAWVSLGRPACFDASVCRVCLPHRTSRVAFRVLVGAGGGAEFLAACTAIVALGERVTSYVDATWSRYAAGNVVSEALAIEMREAAESDLSA